MADPHFGDERILRYENRPFCSVEHMNRTMIERWNSVVGTDDDVWVLGDFGVSGLEREILALLNGRKFLVKGNHDTESNELYRRCGFSEVYDLPVVLESFWLLSHDALYINTNMPYANIFGHVHNSLVVRDFSAQHFCVSAERIDYTPIDFETVRKKIQNAADAK